MKYLLMHMCYFHVFVIVNSAAVSIEVHVCLN